jgi:hypothetical protein
MATVRSALAISMLALGAFVPPLRAADKDDIDKAVAAGVKFLKSIQAKDGTWDYEHGDRKAGATALAGLALLECDVDPEDSAVQNAAQAVRLLSLELNQTYGLSLAILFLDRLGDADDVPLIVSMAVRLQAGQNSTGGWTYNCPKAGPTELKRLAELIKKKEARPVPKKGELTRGGDDDKPARDKGDSDAAAKDMRAQIEAIQRDLQSDPPLIASMAPDNSNTQFANLAMWVARRHGVPVDKTLGRIDARFRSSQNADGGWGYLPSGVSTPAMTCAGLLGLAAGHGAGQAVLKAKNLDDKDKDAASETNPPKKAARDPGKDAAIKAGLKALGSVIGEPPAKGERVVLPAFASGEAIVPRKQYYFLWSLERVAMAYGLDTIGNKDWYAWGAALAMQAQKPDGSWSGEYGKGGVDTSFVLLFLRRANLARDLTVTLKGKVTDPGRVTLKAGGGNDPDPKERANLEPNEKPLEPASEAERMAAELVQAAPAKQERLLDSLREGKGAAHTQALLSAIPKLDGDLKKKARDALAERMSRMTAATLRARLADENAEMRRAAALACAMREEKEHIPRLIELLDDPEAPVARAAHAGLKSLSGKDFGPAKDAGRDEIAKAVAAWKGWWKEQGGK